PTTKEEAVKQLSEGTLEMFHSSWFHGQGHTNLTRWMTTPATSSPYAITTYHKRYEPYVLVGQEAPFCDERFIGYGSNKCACIYELKAAGFQFFVLPDAFLVHRPHRWEEKEED